MDRFEDAVFKTIAKYRLFNRGDRVLVAVSGGPDSVALLLALLELRNRVDITIEAAHINHLLRGAESDEDERFVRELCEQASVPLRASGIETRQQAVEARQNLEEYARTVRYGFLLSVAAERGAKVATGHTLNDLSETFLLKLFRGAGISGLSGVYPKRRNELQNGVTVEVVRPLLDSSRSEILDYLDRRKQSYRQDSSNQDKSFDRNMIRHELIPILENRFNPGISSTLGRTALLFRELEDFLSPIVEEAYQRCRLAETAIALRISDLSSYHPFIQKEIVRRALKEYRGDLKDVSYQHVEDVLKIAAGESGCECHLANGVRVRREFDVLNFGGETKPACFEYELSVPGDVYISEVKKRVSGRLVTSEGGSGATGAVLLDFPGRRLTVRNRRAGDRYRIGGRSKKLKEILIEKKIPRSLRDELIILDDGREIIWVEGLDPNPEFRARSRSAGTLEIRVEHETFPR